MTNEELAKHAAGVLIVAFEKRGDIVGTFDPEWMSKPIEAAIAAAVQAEREACAMIAEHAELDSRALIAAAVQENSKLAALSVLGKYLKDMRTARELAIAISLEAVAIRARVK